ncbi:MAG: hypothetical protein QNJ42_16750 [Crocosphaera sp.]|nr:hypothetical protein [Crocosphaera sp.]
MSHPQNQNNPAHTWTDFEKNLLEKEYFFLQTTVEDYNKQIWIIKALGITGTGAVIGLAIQQQQNIILLVGCMIPIFFWVLENQWKHYQRGFYSRISEIEVIFSRDLKLYTPAIFQGWNQSFKRPVYKPKGYIRDGLLNSSVFVSYLLELIGLLILYKFDFLSSSVS